MSIRKVMTLAAAAAVAYVTAARAVPVMVPLSLHDPLGNAIERAYDAGRGNPAITAAHRGGDLRAPVEVSVVVPAYLLDGQSVVDVVTRLMDRWAPEMCSDLFDFQGAHKQMAVTVYVQDLQWSVGPFRFYRTSEVGGRASIDYRPYKQVRCVVPGDLTS